VLLCLGSAHAAERIVTTQEGQLRGAQLRNPNVYVFKGVHYGRSTAGNNRFLPSLRVAKWSGVKDALEFGPMCPQAVEPGQPPASQKRSSISEDCLVLNVWTPSIRNDEQRRPVMVWLHGPGFHAGAGSEPEYDGARLAKRGDVVVVTLNHRLNVFGHLHLVGFGGRPYASSGNIGLQDIQLALEWIRDNIAVFGGDPDNVTLFGGAKVSTLLGVPSAKGLFHRAIIQGEARTRAIPAAQASNSTRAVMGKLQVKTLEELQAMPMDRLLAAVSTTAGAVPEFGPVLDGAFLPFNMFEPVAAVSAHGIPIMVGTNMVEDASVAHLVEAAVKVAPVYVYKFAFEAPASKESHGAEIPFIFGNATAGRSAAKGAKTAKAVEDAMSGAWIAFARTGNPNHRGLPKWPTYSTKARATMVFDVQSKVVNDPPAPIKQAAQ